ncbi:MAG: low temperature requirement protein A [Microcoleus sp.]
MAKRIWWQKPQIRTDEEQHFYQKVSWLELFLDLIFVVIMAELSHNLAGDLSWVGTGKYILLFLPAWWFGSVQLTTQIGLRQKDLKIACLPFS